MQATTGFGVLCLIVFVVLLIIFMPLLVIWALNTLFPVLAIDYTLKTWFAIIIVAGIFAGASHKSK